MLRKGCILDKISSSSWLKRKKRFGLICACTCCDWQEKFGCQCFNPVVRLFVSAIIRWEVILTVHGAVDWSDMDLFRVVLLFFWSLLLYLDIISACLKKSACLEKQGDRGEGKWDREEASEYDWGRCRLIGFCCWGTCNPYRIKWINFRGMPDS